MPKRAQLSPFPRGRPAVDLPGPELQIASSSGLLASGAWQVLQAQLLAFEQSATIARGSRQKLQTASGSMIEHSAISIGANHNMIENRRIYYYFLLGAAGSLTGWYIAALSLDDLRQLEQSAIFGALLGGLIGMAVASYDGITTRSMVRFFRFGGWGLVVGGLAGAAALSIVQWLYVGMIGEGEGGSVTAPRSILIGLFCWVLLGGMIGLGAVMNKGTQIYKGLLGGFVGATLGGLIYEIARVENTGETKSPFITALSLALLGGAIGASVALITTALQNACFEVTNGKLKGRVYDVTKYVDARIGSKTAGLIGSDANAAWIYLPGDKQVLPRHAEIRYADGAPTLTVFEDTKRANAPTLINGRNIASSMPLGNGDRVQIGGTTLVYRQKGR
jgi:hypothetical protein